MLNGEIGNRFNVNEHYIHRHNLIFPKHNMVLYLNAKCGQTALTECMQLWEHGSVKPALPLKRVRFTDATTTLPEYPAVYILRDPIMRLQSCYTHQITTWKGSHGMAAWISPDCSWPEFVAMVCDCPDDRANVHFRSQIYGFNGLGPDVDDLVIRTENLTDDWNECVAPRFDLFKLGRVVNQSRSPHPEVTFNQLGKIEQRYSDDFEMCYAD